MAFGTRKVLILAAALVLALAGGATAAEQSYEGLIVFTQPGANALEEAFQAEHLPGLRQLAKGLKTDLKVLDAREGAPEEVKLTPLIVYQNERGRSIFQGRYADLGKVGHFVRTSRFVPQGEGTIERTDGAVGQFGRQKTAIQFKVTPLTFAPGVQVDFFAPFEDSLYRDLLSALQDFQSTSSVTLTRSDRTFYWDIHSYLAEDGAWKAAQVSVPSSAQLPSPFDQFTLYLSLAVYSQFNCHDPIFQRFEDPLVLPLQSIYAGPEAARILEAETLRLMAESDLGDGFTPIASEVPVVTWECLGLALPEAEKGGGPSFATGGAVKARAWELDEERTGQDAPPVQFHFSAPLDSYAGVAKTVLGAELALAADGSLDGAAGSVRVEAESVTFGEDGLDDTVQSLLLSGVAPESLFTLKTVQPETPGQPLKLGEPSRLLASGDLEIAGISAPLEGIVAELLPVLTENGEERLEVTASFKVRLLDTYEIEGPPGPAPANDTLEFLVRLVLRPVRG